MTAASLYKAKACWEVLLVLSKRPITYYLVQQFSSALSQTIAWERLGMTDMPKDTVPMILVTGVLICRGLSKPEAI